MLSAICIKSAHYGNYSKIRLINTCVIFLILTQINTIQLKKYI